MIGKCKLFVVLTLFISGAANAATVYTQDNGTSLDVYGRFEQSFGNHTSSSRDRDTTESGYGSVNGAVDMRMGFKGSLYVNDKISVIGKAEYQVNAGAYSNQVGDNGANHDLTIRYFYTGLDAKELGKLYLGRPVSGTVLLSDTVDIFAFGGSETIGARTSLVDKSAVRMFRQDGTVQYDNSLYGFDFSTSYIVGTEKSGLDHAYTGTAKYNIDMGSAGKLAPIVSYYSSKADSTNLELDGYTSFGGGFTYELNSFRIAALYTIDDLLVNKEIVDTFGKNKGLEVAVSYLFDKTYNVKVLYANMKNDSVLDIATNKIGSAAIINEFVVELDYMLSSDSFFYVSYVHRMSDMTDTTSDANAQYEINSSKSPINHIYLAGLRYSF
jgi:predicted porin